MRTRMFRTIRSFVSNQLGTTPNAPSGPPCTSLEILSRVQTIMTCATHQTAKQRPDKFQPRLNGPQKGQTMLRPWPEPLPEHRLRLCSSLLDPRRGPASGHPRSRMVIQGQQVPREWPGMLPEHALARLTLGPCASPRSSGRIDMSQAVAGAWATPRTRFGHGSSDGECCLNFCWCGLNHAPECGTPGTS